MHQFKSKGVSGKGQPVGTQPRAPKAQEEASSAAVEEPLLPPKKRVKLYSGADLNREIDKLLKVSTFEPTQRYWLDTGSPNLNGALGSKVQGLPYGKVTELAGMEHGGKTLITDVIAGMAQQDNAGLGRIDVEDSRDEDWERRLGLDSSSVITIYPRLVLKKKEVSGLESAEGMFARAEVGMDLLSRRGFKKQFWWVDSVAFLQPDEMLEAGTGGQNMRTRVSRAAFLSDVLPKWAGLAANYNAMIYLINQLRDKPGVMFGDPTYSPGGRALRHCCSIRARLRRIKGGLLKNGTRVIGLVGIIQNIKNKAGGGSVQGLECGFKIKWNRDPARVEFMSREDAEGLM